MFNSPLLDVGGDLTLQGVASRESYYTCIKYSIYIFNEHGNMLSYKRGYIRSSSKVAQSEGWISFLPVRINNLI